MAWLDWFALIMGGGLILSGIRAIRQREARLPEVWSGDKAVALGWVWIGLGGLFVLGVVFDIAWLKALFRLFLEAP